MDRGQIISGMGHGAVILWVILGDFLFPPQEMPAISAASVSMVSPEEFQEMVDAAAKAPPKPQPRPEQPPEPQPIMPEPDQPEPLPENNGAADAEDLPVNPEAPPEVPLPPVEDAAPLAADRVAPVPVEAPDPTVETSDAPQDAVTPDPAEEPQVVEEERPETAQEEAGVVLETEANRDQPQEISGAPRTSPRPRGRPVQQAEEQPEEPAEDPLAEALAEVVEETPPEEETDPVADALAEALAEEQAQGTAPSLADLANAGPPMSGSDIDAFRVAVQRCWNVGSLSTEALRTTVVVFVAMGQDGVPDAASIRMVEFNGESEAAANQAYEAARRAIIRCGANGFPLPPDKYDQWRELELEFDPTGMRMR